MGKDVRARQQAEERGLHEQTNLLPRGQLLLAFGTLSLTLLITFIDQNGIGNTLPTIAQDLNAEDTISWAGTSSLIANTAFQMLYGRLSDIFGRKTIYLTAVGLLTVAAALCGVSQNATMLYVFRGIAGIGGGGIANLSMIFISDIVTLEQRGKYQGIIGAFVGVGNVAGPFLASLFISVASWRAFFYMLAPCAGIVGLVSFFMLPSTPAKTPLGEGMRQIDYGGVLLSSAGIILLLIPISGGGSYFAWDSPMVISMLVVGACCFVGFVLYEGMVPKLPMMPCKSYTSIHPHELRQFSKETKNSIPDSSAGYIFNNPVVVVLLSQNFLFGFVYQSYLYYLPVYLQNNRQFSVFKSAGLISAIVGTQAVASILSGQYISWRKRYGEVIWVGFGSWTL